MQSTKLHHVSLGLQKALAKAGASERHVALPRLAAKGSLRVSIAEPLALARILKAALNDGVARYLAHVQHGEVVRCARSRVLLEQGVL